MITLAPSRSATSLICGPENSLLSRMMRAPVRAAPYTAMRNHRWLRARIATPSPPLTPIASSPLATACAASSSSLKVNSPSSSMIAVRLGVRRALSAGIMPNSPQRRMSATIAAMFCGGSSLKAPASSILRQIVQFCRPSLGVLLDFGDCLQRKIS